MSSTTPPAIPPRRYPRSQPWPRGVLGTWPDQPPAASHRPRRNPTPPTAALLILALSIAFYAFAAYPAH